MTSAKSTMERGRRRRRYLPPQHGAWAMLVVPYAAGLLAAGYRWPDVPLLGAWVAGYLLSYYVFQALRSRRPERYRGQILWYAAISVPLAAVTVAARPMLLLYAPAYAALVAVNAAYALRRRERALLNDLASVTQSCLIVFVVATVAGVPPRAVVGPFILCLAYFAGTVLYVKTMIRERGDPRYRRWSIGYHAAALPVAVVVTPWAGPLFAWLLVRSAVFPRMAGGRGMSPKRVGLVEFANSVVLLAVIFWQFGT
jgi:YwiC-like protein